MIFSTVIFDMDGLMFDSERVAQRAWEKAAIEFGYSFGDDVFLGVIGKARRDVEAYTRQVFGPDFPFEQVYALKQQYFRQNIQENGLPFKPGLLELLECLEARSIPKAVASSSPCETILFNLHLAGLALERFATVIGGDEVPHGKPAPDIFQAVADKLRVSSHKCLVLEDSNGGVKAAHAAGMVPVMVPDLIPPTEESIRLAYRILPSLHEVLPLVPA